MERAHWPCGVFASALLILQQTRLVKGVHTASGDNSLCGGSRNSVYFFRRYCSIGLLLAMFLLFWTDCYNSNPGKFSGIGLRAYRSPLQEWVGL